MPTIAWISAAVCHATGFGFGGTTIVFFNYVLPGLAIFVMVYEIRGVALTGKSLYGPQLLIGAGWLVGAFVIAALAYQLTEDG
ncbi:MAG: hypothetical protein WD830_05150 [Chloroflexota bacterium]